jgi:serine/threonine-protein kinase
VLKVLDFGIAKAPANMSVGMTQSQSVLGTPMYMSPEQTRSARNVDARSDLWSLGTVLYELVEGEPPFKAESFAEMCVLIATRPPPPMTRAPQLEAIVQRCLEKKPDERYQNIDAFAADLAAFATEPHGSTYLQRICGALGVAQRTPSTRSLARPISTPAASAPTTPDKPSALAHPRRRWWIAVAIGAAAAAIAIAVLVFGGGDDSGPSVEREPVRATAPPDAAPVVANAPPVAAPADAREPATVQLVVDSTPHGADVYRASDGVKLGKTPFERAYERTDGQAEFVVKLAGYADARVSLSTLHDGSTTARLSRDKHHGTPRPPATTAKPPPEQPDDTKAHGPRLLDPYGEK